MYSKNDLINWYNENIIKTKSINNKQYIKRKIKKNILNNYPNILMKQQNIILLNGNYKLTNIHFMLHIKINQSINN